MQQFGKENPGCGGDLEKLKHFLMAYAKEFSPCMNHHKSFGKYNQGELMRDIFHEAKLMADLERDERIKLNACFLSSGSNKKLIESYLHLPLDTFVNKVRQKWNCESSPRPVSPYLNPSSKTSLVGRPYREFRNTSFSPPKSVVRNEEALCYYHLRFGRKAFKCSGSNCRMWASLTKPKTSHIKKIDERKLVEQTYKCCEKTNSFEHKLNESEMKIKSVEIKIDDEKTRNRVEMKAIEKKVNDLANKMMNTNKTLLNNEKVISELRMKRNQMEAKLKNLEKSLVKSENELQTEINKRKEPIDVRETKVESNEHGTARIEWLQIDQAFKKMTQTATVCSSYRTRSMAYVLLLFLRLSLQKKEG